MGNGTKVIAYEDTGTSIFYKYGYGEGHYNIISIEYPLPSLNGYLKCYVDTSFSDKQGIRLLC